MQVASLCNLSGLSRNEAGVWERVGESTEAALKVSSMIGCFPAFRIFTDLNKNCQHEVCSYHIQISFSTIKLLC